MKKINVLSCVVLIMFSIVLEFSCKKDKDEPRRSSSAVINNGIHYLSEIKYESRVMQAYTYNAQKKVTSEIFYDYEYLPDTSVYTYTYDYNASGQIIRENEIDEYYGSVASYSAYEYNADGKIIKTTYYYNDGMDFYMDSSEYETYEYNLSKQLIRVNRYLSSDEIYYKNKNNKVHSRSFPINLEKYDERYKKNIAKSKSDYFKMMYMYNEYDDNGNIVKQTIYYLNEDLINYDIVAYQEYQYDNKKNPWIEVKLPYKIMKAEGVSKNNISKIIVTDLMEGYTDSLNYSYEYNSANYPVKMYQTYMGETDYVEFEY